MTLEPTIPLIRPQRKVERHGIAGRIPAILRMRLTIVNRTRIHAVRKRIHVGAREVIS